ncbi:hypothetical protein D7030_08435 [Flavobacteriaceae bacterium AU392]|nr:hypothetical protein D1817_14440 [Flavobacteriaceae bacterium]RKM84050.1 hypothetical protein D7030_08435 [Flavobacteriaceae bacterium AU392]
MKNLKNLGKTLNKNQQKLINGGNLPGPVGENEDCIIPSGIACNPHPGAMNVCRHNEVCVPYDEGLGPWININESLGTCLCGFPI